MRIPGFVWSSGDAANINQFLSTPLGIKWLTELMNRRPKTDIQKGVDTSALTGAYVAGYDYLLNEIIPHTRIAHIDETAQSKQIDMTRD